MGTIQREAWAESNGTSVERGPAEGARGAGQSLLELRRSLWIGGRGRGVVLAQGPRAGW